MSTNRISFNTDVSAQVQSDISSLAAQLEALIGERQQQVNTAMADFQADGVSEEYRVVEQRWNRAASETRSIIALVKQTLAKNDHSATSAGQAARSAVQGIG